jgi:flagella basal body P-ring formation protein FlgA
MLALALPLLCAQLPAESLQSVVVFSVDVEVGQRLTAEMLSQRKVPASLVTPGVVVLDDAGNVLSQTLVEPGQKGAIVSWGHFSAAMSDNECPGWVTEKPRASPGDPGMPDKPRRVVIAARNVAQGAVLTAADLAETELPVYLPGRFIPGAADKAKLVGERALVRFFRGDFVRYSGLAGWAHADRCKIYRREWGNVFDERGAPAELGELACPKEAKAVSGKHVLLEGESPTAAAGWTYGCVLPDGRADGPAATWSRRGELIERASFAGGVRDGKTVITNGAASTTLEFTKGTLTSALPAGSDIEAVVAKLPLRAGMRMDRAMFNSVPTSMAVFPSIVSTVRWRDVSGRVLKRNVAKGAPLFYSDLDAP